MVRGLGYIGSLDDLRTLHDEDGWCSGWVELYNAGDVPQLLTESFLAVEGDPARRWRFPEVSLGPRGFLTVFCSGKARAVRLKLKSPLTDYLEFYRRHLAMRRRDSSRPRSAS